MAVHKVNTTPPAWTCSTVAVHASPDAVYPHAWLTASPACFFIVILFKYNLKLHLPGAA